MNPDLALVLGVVIAGFSIPAIVSAFSDSRAPRAASLMVLLGGALIAWALTTKPGGYTLEQIPDVFIKVTRALLG
ncbi:MAG: hypothetical protein P8P65_01885 [Planktotalea sp.]|jgi:hypothetical protein|uniref:hypothetical protein n=1 Tax=Planktotalea sp. TaxID=2029877 RepID=UPI00018398C5|nr:hypothetical protein [Planktotalea sp.]EDZ41155.1 conserved hypothetical protein [Rhodobacteraceae bacterium HTCC2083]MBT5822726.1 hypothetical protein [Paracoccaceae bacterium]MDG1075387.1 hypothetical protein [Planktotalea sp.]MDG1083476.1 hypothetical protein [Planktotalea sp.]HCW84338.1 hypothetical protein [Paracoccaceae bacterium]